MEIKTLKDLNLNFKAFEDENIKNYLRREAIKWVKDCDCFGSPIICSACLRFKHFFNITEDDLNV